MTTIWHCQRTISLVPRDGFVSERAYASFRISWSFFGCCVSKWKIVLFWGQLFFNYLLFLLLFLECMSFFIIQNLFECLVDLMVFKRCLGSSFQLLVITGGRHWWSNTITSCHACQILLMSFSLWTFINCKLVLIFFITSNTSFTVLNFTFNWIFRSIINGYVLSPINMSSDFTMNFKHAIWVIIIFIEPRIITVVDEHTIIELVSMTTWIKRHGIL